jgi:dynein heavy chain
MGKELSNYKAPQSTAFEIRDECDDFLKNHLPLLKLLANPGLRPRHWEEMSDIVGFVIKQSDTSTLNDMIAQNLHLYANDIEEVCVNASREASMERTIKQMKADWENVNCELKDHKLTGTYILTSGCVDQVQALLDDQLVKAQSMQSSRYAVPFLPTIKAWVHDLTCVQDVFDALLKVQVSWLYLEPIFSSQDIKHQMPVESKRFDEVDLTWRRTMKECLDLKNVMTFSTQANLLERLSRAKELLDQIQKGLNDYLETKRLYFPRFFFLSNDELLEILSETKDPLRVQPHLKKCFEGIHKLQFTESLDIVAMYSNKGEKVPFAEDGYLNPKDSRGNVEMWLLQVETQMRRACALSIDKAVVDYSVSDRSRWVRKWPGQATLTGSQIMWTAEVEAALRSGGAKAVALYAKKCTAQLLDIVELVRGELPDLVRDTLGALVVLDVHSRDVTVSLGEQGVDKVTDFAWSSQMRYYWLDNNVSATIGEVGSMDVHMINAHIQYAYEYLGTQGRLVITPLTDRCYRTLMGIFYIYIQNVYTYTLP